MELVPQIIVLKVQAFPNQKKKKKVRSNLNNLMDHYKLNL